MPSAAGLAGSGATLACAAGAAACAGLGSARTINPVPTMRATNVHEPNANQTRLIVILLGPVSAGTGAAGDELRPEAGTRQAESSSRRRPRPVPPNRHVAE